MKKLYFQLFSVLFLLSAATPTQSQESKIMQVYSGGEVAYEIASAQVDSITFKANIITTKATGYIVGYHQCGLTVENGTGRFTMCFFISENLQDTLQVHNFPQDIYDFPEEVFEMPPGKCLTVKSFSEEYRYTFKVQLEYTVPSSYLELEELSTYRPCIMPAICSGAWPVYAHSVPIIAYSAKKIE